MDPKCILFSVPNSGPEKWPISQQPGGNLWALLLVSNMGQRKKKLATSSDLGAFWSILGTVLEHSGVVLERSGGFLGSSWKILGSF